MTAEAQKVLDQALTLSPEMRSEVAELLLISLDDGSPAEIEEAWDEEIAMRLKEIDDGTVKMIPGDEVRKMMRDIVEGRDEEP